MAQRGSNPPCKPYILGVISGQTYSTTNVLREVHLDMSARVAYLQPLDFALLKWTIGW